MTAKKAIELLFDLAHEDIALEHPDYNDAIKLGMESLERQLAVRKDGLFVGPGLLPSETSDE